MSKEFLGCPKCHNVNNLNSEISRDYGVVWFEVNCYECGFEWVENYEHISNTDHDSNELDENGNPIKDMIENNHNQMLTLK